MTPADIAAQVGAAGGLWTHTPTDWAGNESNPPTAKPASFPLDASAGRWGAATGSRPNQVAFIVVPPAGGVGISAISVSALGTTTASITFTLSSVPTSSRVNYGTTPAAASNTAGTTATQQTVALSGLTTKTTYYFSVQATNANGTTVTSLGSFTTL